MDIRNNVVATEKFVEDYLLQNQSDWNQSDSSQKNYIKNRTHYEYEVEGKLVFEGIATSDYISNPNLQLVNDVIYHLYIDDTMYSAICMDAGSDGYFLDFPSVAWMENHYIHIANFTKPVNVKLYEAEAKVQELDEKYIPTTVPRAKTAEVGDIVVVKAVNEDGIPTEWEAVKGQNNQDYLTLKDRTTGYEYFVYMDKGSLESCMRSVGIKVITLPNKTDYTDTEEFDPTGMVVVSVGQDGTETVITDYEYDKYVTTESTTHEIRYVEATGNINVIEIPITTRTLEMALVDFTYTTNNDGTYTITGWNQTLNGEPSTRMLVPNSELVIV